MKLALFNVSAVDVVTEAVVINVEKMIMTILIEMIVVVWDRRKSDKIVLERKLYTSWWLPSCQDNFFLEIKLSPLGGNYPALSSSNFGKSSAFYLLTCKYLLPKVPRQFMKMASTLCSEIYEDL